MAPILLPPTEFEDRTALYEDVRSLLAPGFISEAVTLNGHRFVFRTFTAEDFFLLRARAGPGAEEKRARAWTMATAIWMIDGQIIHGHQESLLRVYRMCCDLPSSVYDAFSRQLINLTKRMQDAVLRTEAYLYEMESRALWRGGGTRMLEHPPIRVGVNRVQHLWSFYNTVEDQREHNQYLWALTKFVAGTQAPKGIQKLNAKELKQEADLERKRQQVRDRMFYEAHGIPFPSETESRRYLNVNPMETEEDLKREMARWLRGEKDWHDQIIDFVKNKIRRSVEERRAQEENRQNELAQILQQERSESMEILSPELAQTILQRGRGPKQVYQDATHNSAYEKYLAQDPIPGHMVVDPNRGVPTTASPLDDRTVSELWKEVLQTDPKEIPERDLKQYLDTHPPTVRK